MIEFSDNEVEEFHLHVGKKVKVLREAKGLSQLELALAIGHRSSALVGKAELGTYKKHFNIEHLYKISKVLNVSLCELLIYDIE